MNQNLSKLERVPLRDAWKHEAGEFTPWLAETDNLNALADVLGVSELVLVATEHWVGDFKFEVVVKPNDWVKTGREQARAASSTSPTKQLQQKFWTALIEYLTATAPQIRPQKPRPQHWLNNSIGRAGFGLNITANTRDERLGVELWMPGAEAKRHFANLSAQREDIEGKLGFELDWQELPDAKACRIASWYPHASIEEESRWNEYLDWLAQRLVKMDEVLRPIVKALP